MFESIFTRPSIRVRHQKAPLLIEREEYLRHLRNLGRNRGRLQNAATELLHVIRLMQLTTLRYVRDDEIKEAAVKWAMEEEPHRMIRGNRSSANRFSYTARHWLSFQHLLVTSAPPEYWFDQYLIEFAEAIRLRLTPATIDNYVRRTKAFLLWLSNRGSKLSSISIEDVDDFILERRRSEIRPATLTAECQAIRSFLGYARSRGWCEARFIRNIRNPVPRRPGFYAVGPSWKDVRKLIESLNGRTVADLRAKAIILLCAIYGLRNSEVARLTLEDFDWRNETFVIRRSKGGKKQQFPIQYEVGQAVICYLQSARPQCKCRHLFVTQHAPYRKRAAHKTAVTASSPQNLQLSNNYYYVNSDGRRVHFPAKVASAPLGAAAVCRDGSYSFSQHHRGTCSPHGGVSQWL
ncbi:MAG: DUF3761 domain-containing protein [Silvibacterium sp.]